jgi:acyl-coenzyme A synthetase/AMP-(fatty) acid ligase
LRRRIDAVFLPRPLLMLERLPRNSTGKLPHQALQALADQHSHPRAGVAQSPSKRSPRQTS